MSKICPYINAALCIESSVNDDLLFIGGNHYLESGKTEAIISVIDVSDMNNVREISTFNLAEEEMISCLKLTRLEIHEARELLLVSGNQHLLLLEYLRDYSTFQVVQRFPHLQSGEIYDFSISNGAVITCCPRDSFLHKF